MIIQAIHIPQRMRRTNWRHRQGSQSTRLATGSSTRGVESYNHRRTRRVDRRVKENLSRVVVARVGRVKTLPSSHLIKVVKLSRFSDLQQITIVVTYFIGGKTRAGLTVSHVYHHKRSGALLSFLFLFLASSWVTHTHIYQ